jgi:hypothetical protein
MRWRSTPLFTTTGNQVASGVAVVRWSLVVVVVRCCCCCSLLFVVRCCCCSLLLLFTVVVVHCCCSLLLFFVVVFVVVLCCCSLLLFTVVVHCCCLLLFTAVVHCCCSLLFIVVHCCSLLLFTVAVPLDTINGTLTPDTPFCSPPVFISKVLPFHCVLWSWRCFRGTPVLGTTTCTFPTVTLGRWCCLCFCLSVPRWY